MLKSVYINSTDKINEWVSLTKSRKMLIPIYVRKNLVLEVQPLPLAFKTLAYSAPIESEDTIHQHNFYSCQIICNSPGTFEIVWHSVMRPANAGIDWGGRHFSICCELTS